MATPAFAQARGGTPMKNISADTVSADILWLNGFMFPLDAPQDNEVIKWDSALNRLNYEPDATGAAGTGIAGLGNQYQVAFWQINDTAISGDTAFQFNDTTNVLTLTGLFTDGTDGFFVGQVSKDISIISSDMASLTTKATIISNDASLIFPYISQDITDINSELQIITNDAIWWNSIVNDNESISADVVSGDLISIHGLLLPTDWPTVAGSVISYDGSILKWGTIAGGSGAVSSVAEGTAGPLVITPTTGAVLISIASADISGTDGYLKSVDYLILTSDAAERLLETTILSDDAVIQDVKLNILSDDVGVNITKLLILTSDAVGWTATTLKTNIISNDASLIFPYVSQDIADLNVETFVLSEDVTNISSDASLIFPYVSSDISTLNNRTIIISNDSAVQETKLTIITNDAVGWGKYQKSMTFIEPDQIATVTADVLMFPVDSYEFPTGITITKVGLAANTSTTCSYSLEEWTTSDWSTASISSIDVIYLTASAESTDTAIADSSVAAGSWVVVGIDSVDLDQTSIQIWFTRT